MATFGSPCRDRTGQSAAGGLIVRRKANRTGRSPDVTAHRANATRSAPFRLWQRATGDDGAALGFLAPAFSPKPRVGAALGAQVGFSRPSGGEKDIALLGAFFEGAAE